MKSLKYFLLFLVAVSLITENKSCFSQDVKIKGSKNTNFFDRITVGGALGFSLGTYSSLIDISPIVGYSISDDLVIGIGGTYKYYSITNNYYDLDNDEYVNFETNIYGASIWSRYFLTSTETPILESMFIHGEVEPLVFVNKYKLDPSGNFVDRFGNNYVEEDYKINTTGIFLGGGYRQMVGARSYMYIEVVWNFNEELFTPYSNPRIRMGFAAGL